MKKLKTNTLKQGKGVTCRNGGSEGDGEAALLTHCGDTTSSWKAFSALSPLLSSPETLSSIFLAALTTTRSIVSLHD
jgi:hypothetical protein